MEKLKEKHEPFLEREYVRDDESTTSDSTLGEGFIRLEPKKGCAKFCLHLKLLLQKNLLLFWRNKKITLFQLLTPILSVFILWVLQVIFSSLQGVSFPNPGDQVVGTLPHCLGEDCVTLGYFIIGDSQDVDAEEYKWIHHTMRYTAHRNNLTVEQDVRNLLITPSTKFVKDYLDNNLNKTWYGIVFCTTQWDDGVTSDISIPCRPANYDPERPDAEIMFYSILYNYTLMPSSFLNNWTAPAAVDENMLIIKNSIDSGIVSFLKERDGQLPQGHLDHWDSYEDEELSHIEASWSNFPLVASRAFKEGDISSLAGTFYVALGPIVTFVVMLTEIVREKEQKLRQGLWVVGLSHAPYWIHWFITGTFFSAVVSIATILIGLATQFQLFFHTNIFILFFLFFFFTLTLVGCSFVFATLCPNQKVAYTVSYAFVLLCIVILIMVSNPLLLYFIFFNDKSGSYMGVVRAFFFMIPPFTFSMIFGVIVRKSTSHFDDNAQQFLKGTGFGWADLVQPEVGEFSTGDTYSSPTPLFGFGILFIELIVYTILVWYFDHVISSNRGTDERFYFFATRNYWENLWCKKKAIARRRKEKEMQMRAEVEYQEDPKVDDSINQEKLKVIQDMKDGIPCRGIRVTNLKKTYKRYPCGIRSKKDVYANQGIYLDMSDNELLCILGHNGAGKSTMISVLTGLTAPSSGAATLGGYDIVEEIDEVRQIIGVVPQFDILWDELTAEEHMRLFCRIKGVPEEDIEETINDKLSSVKLLDVKKGRTKTFSGGMKRRLTVAISCIGDPKIVFMDEPTTGMDPVSRRQVWDLIQRLKSKRHVILTTHAMEEADVLGDRIAVIVDGKLKCIGTPLYLKNNFGDGYRITIVVDPENVERAIDLMEKIIPAAKLLDESGGSIVFSVPINNIQEISPILKLLEKESKDFTLQGEDDPYLDELKEIVTDCGLSQTTLEEVFMLVTGKKESKRGSKVPQHRESTTDKRVDETITKDYSPKKFEEDKSFDNAASYHKKLLDS